MPVTRQDPAAPLAPSPWAAPLDVLAAGALTIAALIAVFGGIRFTIGPIDVSATSVWKAAAFFALVVALRSRVAPGPSLATRTTEWLTRAGAWWRSPPARAALPVWLATRLGVVAVAFLGMATVGMLGGEPRLRATKNPLLDMADRWDTGWYMSIAVEGYRWDPATHGQQNIAFFPGYPLLMRVGGALLGARPNPPLRYPASDARLRTRTLLAGWLMSLAAFFAALCALHTWVARRAGNGAAARTMMLLATFPFAVYFSAAYTESLFLLGCIAAFNAMDSARPRAAGAWGLFVGLTRPNGFLLALPLLLIAWRHPRGRVGLSIAAGMPMLGMLLFSAYLWSLTGRPFAWAEAHAAWGRTPLTWSAVDEKLDLLVDRGVLGYVSAAPLDVLNGAAVLFALAWTPVVARKLGAPAAVFVVSNLLPPLAAGGLMSMGRLTSTLFPVFAAMALAVPRRHVPAWLIFFTLLQGLAAVLFFTWRPLV
jgi:hypothetical protein